MAKNTKAFVQDFAFYEQLWEYYSQNRGKIRSRYNDLTKKFLAYNDSNENSDAFLREPQFEALEMYVFIKEFMDNAHMYQMFDEWRKRENRFSDASYYTIHKGGQGTLLDIGDEQNEIVFKQMKKGNPNEEGGEYKTAIGVLYAVAYTLKMSYKTDYKIEGFFEYVVPPLEGFWWQDNVESIDYTDKSAFNWISVIRLPDFITKKDFDWAVETASKKKKMDCSGAEFLSIDEGLCVQIMHIGAFDDEPATVAMMDKYLEENGYVNDFTDERRHHEIYLSDPRKVAPEKCKTVIRHPIKKA